MNNPCLTKCPLVAIIGDSIAVPIAYQMKIIRYCRINNIAYSGDNIQAQEIKWDALSASVKSSFDYIFVQVGINNYGDTAVYKIPYYQSLIDKINATRKSDSKLICATMTPCSTSPVHGGVAQTIEWNLLNAAIRGEGSTPITGIDQVITSVTSAMNDGSDGLLAVYNEAPTLYVAGDNLHPNILGNILNAQAFANCLA